MPYFSMLVFQHWVLASFLGGGAVILTCMAFGARWHRSERKDVNNLEDLLSDNGSHLNLLSHYKRNPHGLFLSLIYLGVLVWIVAYYFLVGLGARAIW